MLSVTVMGILLQEATFSEVWAWLNLNVYHIIMQCGECMQMYFRLQILYFRV